jgi:BirA family biotin operon repressor/biotin-[acetyl-CoA-carboxylase] ligase
MPDPLPAGIQAALDHSVDRRGRCGDPTIFFAEATSTNEIAAALADRGATAGTMVLALAQTAGRGRLGRVWFSPAGAGLYASVISRNPKTVPLITLAGGVAVAEGIRAATGLPVLLKWPNDVVLADTATPSRRRKLAGILAEGSTGAGGLQYVVLGFGVNIKPAAYPPEISGRATSLEAELGREVDAGLVLAEILAVLNQHLTGLAAGESEGLLTRWKALAPSAVGTRVEWTTPGGVMRGITAGIDGDGALRVRTGDRVERIVAGEVTWL